MVRTDNTSRIKQRVADEVRGEEEAQKSRVIELARDREALASTESGPHDGTNGKSPKNIQTAKEGEEGEDEKRSAAASEEEKDEMKKRPAPDVGENDEEELEDVTVPSFQNDHKTWSLFKYSLRDCMRRRRQRQEANQDLRKQARHQGLPDSQISWFRKRNEPISIEGHLYSRLARARKVQGKRKVYKLRRTECPFQFLAQTVQTKGK
ncbi:hypothetical protein GQ600_2687 [Phytophthora cactorum]|nr:hypothetical protein GQ600_2687 [Phytophthora cactorum]